MNLVGILYYSTNIMMKGYLLIYSLYTYTEAYQMEMMRNLRHVNIDHLHVGWYQSTYFGSFLSRALLESQFNYQHSIGESVVLTYGMILHDVSINTT